MSTYQHILALMAYINPGKNRSNVLSNAGIKASRGRWRKLTAENELFLVLVRLRLGLFQHDLAHRFGITHRTVSRICVSRINFTQIKTLQTATLGIKSCNRRNISCSIQRVLNNKGYFVRNGDKFSFKDFHCNQAIKWAKQYGPIYRVKTGSTDVVIINDFQLIKKYLPKKELLNRPQNWFFNEGEYQGVASFNGDVWMDNRRFSMQVLRDIGYGKTSMEENVKGECHGIVKQISRANGSPIPVHNLLLTSISSNIASLVYGTRHAHDDPHRLYMDKMLLGVFEAIGSGSMLEFLPMFVRQLLRKLPSTRRNDMATKVKEFIQYTKRQVEEHKQTLNNDSNRDFIDGYLKKIKEHEKEPKSNFTPKHLVGNAMALFFGGSGTVTLALQWHFLNFADKPDTVQARVQEEIDQVVGRERQPTWEDRQKMHYTMACIWEMNRWKTVSPLGVPRCVLEDTVFGEFYIPSGTTVVPNLWAVHNDPKLWKEPSKFDPNRFLGEDGCLVQPKPEYLIPFSVGTTTHVPWLAPHVNFVGSVNGRGGSSLWPPKEDG
ncbi:hypothetical protein HPB49_015321 [Dermacentor silvarum]|uniref:Uncharacterized protein n=1 Tax=Dermacentor silvarum TaxID=543639 RepID=A0ACB8CY63_DERSI|nr:hypothetical protein HPB49_015321 [Dermacentor silvarum]